MASHWHEPRSDFLILNRTVLWDHTSGTLSVMVEANERTLSNPQFPAETESRKTCGPERIIRRWGTFLIDRANWITRGTDRHSPQGCVQDIVYRSQLGVEIG